VKNLADQQDHAALRKGSHDDRARQDFAFSLRNLVTSRWMPATRTVFDKRARPAFVSAEGREPDDPRAIRQAMDRDSWYRFYLSARRTSQELIWESVVPAVAADPPQGGEGARLDPGVTPPRYMSAVDIHCMPAAMRPIGARATWPRGRSMIAACSSTCRG
jgi:hypothetical protein